MVWFLDREHTLFYKTFVFVTHLFELEIDNNSFIILIIFLLNNYVISVFFFSRSGSTYAILSKMYHT